MAFIITKDNVASADDKKQNPEGKCNAYAKGVMGPRTISDQAETALLAGEGQEFRMRFDEPVEEEKPAYYGRYLEEDDSDEFQPLDCFGTPNAGCAWIEYKNTETGEWEAV